MSDRMKLAPIPEELPCIFVLLSPTVLYLLRAHERTSLHVEEAFHRIPQVPHSSSQGTTGPSKSETSTEATRMRRVYADVGGPRGGLSGPHGVR